MRTLQFTLAAVGCLWLTASAAAQTYPNPATPNASTVSTSADATSHWFAAGGAGSNFGNNAKPSSMGFGGTIGYLRNDRYGVVFDAGITPNFKLQSNFFGLGITPQIGTYMGNALVAWPLGTAERRWQPFISGGAGMITLRSTLPDGSNGNASRFGGNVGGGLMMFAGHVGFKADVQYFRATGRYNTGTAGGTTTTTTGTPPPTGSGPYGATASATAGGVPPAVAIPADLSKSVLTGLHFWRTNVGITVRW